MTLLPLSLVDYPCKTLEDGDDFSFDCGDPDLTEFFHEFAIPHDKELIGVTHFFYDEMRNAAISFFTLSSDVVKTDSFRDALPIGKRYCYYPAVKIGRFGVNKTHQRQNVGVQTMNFIKSLLTEERKIGCRFITVDAYNKPNVLNFYIKNGFVFLSEKDLHKQTRAMIYDLKLYINESETINTPQTPV